MCIYLFAMFTIIPAVTGSLGIIPMLFYDLNNEKKEAMYKELLARRMMMTKVVENADAETLESMAAEQIAVDSKK